ncbi:glycosyltransferase family 39 protein [Leptolyngbya sp. FACHB-261]|uniref:glycosyltransferase family 39 protein n=1 Tax=Leptolyngbya sp. FACHB-261 TaxID=2692806 RepID=UPI001686C4D0|nr:glycosyltransferase family 39 protein [Leptolyngbya sp. FACHB-261]MBD2100209.1 glycosyltransferase family 39 protein [Leptolyngbya sp. FACHB-261]
MLDLSTKSRQPVSKPVSKQLQLLVIILLILGIFFRFVHLDRKVYWIDENFTSLRIAGYTEPEVIQELRDKREVSTEDLLKYQRLNPEKGMVDTLRGLAIEEPQHTPLYFVLIRLWTQWFGNSVTATRSLSALISLLAFPCIYWLCRELFDSPAVAWVAVGLLAISPFHVLYAQEARPYSLWTVTTLLSSVALLRAIRLQTKLSWGMYAIAMALGLYSFLFSVLVSLSHGIYVLALEGFRLTKTVTAYILASLVGALAFLPWVLVAFSNRSSIKGMTSWAYTPASLEAMVKSWMLSLSRIFFDWDRGWCFPVDSRHCRYLLNFRDPLLYLIVPIVILVSYSIYFLCRGAPKRAWLFILALIGVTALALILPDLVSGGQRSGMTRYFIPCLLGIELAVAYCIATQIKLSSGKRWQQKSWQIGLVVLFSVGVLSCAVSSPAETWWTKIHNYDTYSISRIINKVDRPLVIFRATAKAGTLGNYMMPLAHLLKPDVQFQLLFEPNEAPQIPAGFNEIFLFKPSEELRQRLEAAQGFRSELIYEHATDLKPGFNMPDRPLWKLVRERG